MWLQRTTQIEGGGRHQHPGEPYIYILLGRKKRESSYGTDAPMWLTEPFRVPDEPIWPTSAPTPEPPRPPTQTNHPHYTFFALHFFLLFIVSTPENRSQLVVVVVTFA